MRSGLARGKAAFVSCHLRAVGFSQELVLSASKFSGVVPTVLEQAEVVVVDVVVVVVVVVN